MMTLKYSFQEPVGEIRITEDWSGEGNGLGGLQWPGGVVLRYTCTGRKRRAYSYVLDWLPSFFASGSVRLLQYCFSFFSGRRRCALLGLHGHDQWNLRPLTSTDLIPFPPVSSPLLNYRRRAWRVFLVYLRSCVRTAGDGESSRYMDCRQVFPEDHFVGCRVIEVGAGCGLTSIYATLRGADVTITDIDTGGWEGKRPPTKKPCPVVSWFVLPC